MAEGACSWTWVDGERIDVFPDPRITELFPAIERLRSGRQERRLGAELADDLVRLRRACDLLELEFADRAAAFAATDEYDQQGYLNPTHWMRYECRMGYQAALNATAVGEQAPVLPQSTEAMREVFGKETVFVRGGGSIPIVGDFVRELKTPTVMMGFGLPDDNLHAPNEKFHLANFHRGIESIVRWLELVMKSVGSATPRPVVTRSRTTSPPTSSMYSWPPAVTERSVTWPSLMVWR